MSFLIKKSFPMFARIVEEMMKIIQNKFGSNKKD